MTITPTIFSGVTEVLKIIARVKLNVEGKKSFQRVTGRPFENWLFPPFVHSILINVGVMVI